ncbi:helix-turn-helix transcriptional regulator [Cellulosilyticum ruminicola]|uniref:helix-turn-helix transcriptional regulator n=1 Tax=Cellulosilyticum ruminicola TaxID=425254 RepID=UPI0006CF48DB|nr:AraC family transcriptional regulator [Cellulosilyticum ruminicola]
MLNLELIMTTMEHFHHCTLLPIRFFTNLNAISDIYRFGCSDMNLDILKKYTTKELLTSLICSLPEKRVIHHPLAKDIYLTFYPLNMSHIKEGCFVIGPYTTNLKSDSQLVFKPLHCMPHLLILLDSLYAHETKLVSSKIEGSHQHTLNKETIDDYSYHVTKAIIYIEQNYDKPLTLQKVANYLGINKSYFCTIFKQVMKQSFCTYIQNFRLEKSKGLLINTDDSILNIALNTGFNSSSYFNNIFKKNVGQTPLEYRQSHR